jgi:integration host factor subunit alpha
LGSLKIATKKSFFRSFPDFPFPMCIAAPECGINRARLGKYNGAKLTSPTTRASALQIAAYVRSHFLGSCGRNVALVQYLIGPMSGKTVTRADLHQAIYQKFGLSRTQSATLVELVLKEITDCLERGETVKLSRLGSFLVRKKGQRMGRNPRTGEEVPISPRRVVVFKPSAVLKQRINAPGAPSP